jgi:hypothetical protein
MVFVIGIAPVTEKEGSAESSSLEVYGGAMTDPELQSTCQGSSAQAER